MCGCRGFDSKDTNSITLLFWEKPELLDHLVALDTVIRMTLKERRHVWTVFFDLEGAYDTT